MGWFSDLVSSVTDFVTAPLGTTANTVEHLGSVVANNPVATAIAVGSVAYATGGASLAETAAANAVEASATSEATAAATSQAIATEQVAAGVAAAVPSAGITLSDVAGATSSAVKGVTTLATLNSLINPSPSRANSGAGVFYVPQASLNQSSPTGNGVSNSSGAGNFTIAPPSAPLSNGKLALYALGALTIYEALK